MSGSASSDHAIHLVTLRFSSDELERAFREEAGRSAIVGWRVFTGAAILVSAGFDLTDSLFAPGVLGSLRLIRFGLLLPCLCLFFAASYRRPFARHVDWLAVTMLSTIWVLCLWLVALYPSELSTSVTSVMLVPMADAQFLFCISLVPLLELGAIAGGFLRFIPALSLSPVIIALTLGTQALLRPSIIGLVFGFIMTGMTTIISLFLSYHQELKKRQDFSQLHTPGSMGAAPAYVAPSLLRGPGLAPLSGSVGAPGRQATGGSLNLNPDPRPTGAQGDPRLWQPGQGYEILGLLGTGGSSEVYLARVEGPGGFTRRIALKRTLSGGSGDELASHPGREARLLSEMDHPCLVQVYGVELLDHTPCLLMELVDGLSLGDMLQLHRDYGTRLPEAIVAEIGIEVCDGLHHAHEHAGPGGASLSLVHRDIKPANILISRHGQVKVTDFGIAKSDDDAATATRTDVIKGTFTYMSPEQMAGNALDRRSDLFSLGIVLFEALTGAPFFPRLDLGVITTTLAEGFHSRARAQIRAMAPAWEPIFEGLLAPRPQDRLPDAAALMQALQERFGGCPRLILAREAQRCLEEIHRDVSATAARQPGGGSPRASSRQQRTPPHGHHRLP